MKIMHILTYAVVIAIAVNWVIIGLFKFDIISSVLGNNELLISILYPLAGLAVFINIISEISFLDQCDSGCSNPY